VLTLVVLRVDLVRDSWTSILIPVSLTLAQFAADTASKGIQVVESSVTNFNEIVEVLVKW
jgi:hypothetical protein